MKKLLINNQKGEIKMENIKWLKCVPMLLLLSVLLLFKPQYVTAEKVNHLDKQEIETNSQQDVELFQDFDPQNNWSEITTMEKSEIDLGDKLKLAYMFGTEQHLGMDKLQPYKIQTPNVFFKDGDKNVFAYYQAQYGLATTFSSMFGVANKEMGVIAPLDNNSNAYYYQKEMLNGSKAYLLIVDDQARRMKTSTVMYGLQSGFVRVNTRFQNKSDKPLENTIVASAYDTMLDGNDDVPIKFLGRNKGLFIEANGYRLLYRFDVQDGPANWMGGEYLIPSTFISEKGFSTITARGMEASTGEYGDIAADNVDTGISMKSQPMTLQPNEFFDMGYIIGVQKKDGEPTISLDQEDQYFEGGDFKISGEWFDESGAKMDLYYVVDGEPPVKFAHKLKNERPGEAYGWEYIVPKLAKKNHQIKVYAINADEAKSKERIVNLKYLIKPNLKETIYRQDGSLAQEVFPNEMLNFVIELDTIQDVKTAYTKLEFNTKWSEFLDKPKQVAVEIEGEPPLFIDDALVQSNQFLVALNKKISLSKKVTLKYSAKVKAETPVNTNILLSTNFSGTTENGTKVAEIRSNECSIKIMPVASELEAHITNDTGDGVTTAMLGETLRFSAKLKVNPNLDGKIYESLQFSSQLDDNLSAASVMKMQLKDGTDIGIGIYDEVQHRVDFKLNRQVSTAEEILVSYRAKVKPTTALNKVIPFEMTLVEGIASQLPLIKADSNRKEVSVREGLLEFISSPELLSFGDNLEVSAHAERYPLKSKSQDLIVQDNRAGMQSWRLTARLVHPFETKQQEKLKETLIYKTPQKETVIGLASDAVIKEQSSSTNEEINISNDWSQDEGLFLAVPAGVARIKNYQAVLEWKLQDVPSMHKILK